MKSLLCGIALLVCVACVSGQYVNCTGKDDGIYLGPIGPDETNCTRYVECEGGVESINQCFGNLVFDLISESCKPKIQVAAPCGYLSNCTGRANGNYPDLTRGCQAFFTCRNEIQRRFRQCPEDLVYDEPRQICNEARDVCPPCGTGDGLVVEPCSEEDAAIKQQGKSLYQIYREIRDNDV